MMLGGLSWRTGEGLEEAAGQVGSDGGRFAMQKILVDVVCVALQPGGVEEDVLTALLHRALCGRRRVTLKETLHEGREGAGNSLPKHKLSNTWRHFTTMSGVTPTKTKSYKHFLS